MSPLCLRLRVQGQQLNQANALLPSCMHHAARRYGPHWISKVTAPMQVVGGVGWIIRAADKVQGVEQHRVMKWTRARNVPDAKVVGPGRAEAAESTQRKRKGYVLVASMDNWGV